MLSKNKRNTTDVTVITGKCKIANNKVTSIKLASNESKLTFPSIRGNFNLIRGKWYYEAILQTEGLVQIGFAESGFTADGMYNGVGDDKHSWSYDGSRQTLFAYDGYKNRKRYGDKWKCGDVVGCCIDIGQGSIRFSLNGKDLGIACKSIKFKPPVFPAASLTSHYPGPQTLTFVFNDKDFKYPIPYGYNAINPNNTKHQDDEKEESYISVKMLRLQKEIKELKNINQHQQNELNKTIQELRKAKETIKVFKIQIAKLQEEKKEDELRIIEIKKEMESLRIKAIDVNNYEKWKHNDILLWILSIEDVNGNKLFEKYKHTLSKELANNELTGMDLVNIEKSDLKDLGINVFKDRNLLYQKIKQIIDKNEKPTVHNNYMMDEGLNGAPTVYIG